MRLPLPGQPRRDDSIELQERVFKYLRLRLACLADIVRELRTDPFDTNQALEELRLSGKIYPIRKDNKVLWRVR